MPSWVVNPWPSTSPRAMVYTYAVLDGLERLGILGEVEGVEQANRPAAHDDDVVLPHRRGD